MPERSGRVVHTGQAIVDLVLRVDALPPAGGDVFASEWSLRPGGGFNTMAAAARDGARVVHTGAHGTGTFGDRVRDAMDAEGIDVLAEARPDADTGFCVAIVDAAAERTFVSTLGAEANVELEVLRSVDVASPDVVHVSGYSLHHATTREVLAAWLPGVPSGVEVVVDASPVIGDVEDAALATAVRAATLWSVSEREARILLGRLNDAGSDAPADVAATRLCDALGTPVLVRTGPDGCLVARADAEVARVPGFEVVAVDTNGAGDTHTGVVCAALARRLPLVDAVRRANVAAAIATTRPGPGTAPLAKEIDAALEG